MAQSTALTVKSARDLLESRKGEFAKALVNRIDPEAFIRVAHMAMSKQPALLECTPASLLMALMEAASLGLMPNGVLGHGYIIPYRNHGVMEAQFQPGYRGLIDLARRSGAVKSIVPRSVNTNDRFEIEYGLDERMVHVPNLDEPGELRFVYAVAKLTDGTDQFHVMPIKDVERIRARSRAAKNGPWVTDYEAMAWKTVIKQLIKFLPLSLEVDQAVQQDNAAEFGGDFPVFSAEPPRAAITPASRTEQLRGRIAARQIAPAASVQDAVEVPIGEVDLEELQARHEAARAQAEEEKDEDPSGFELEAFEEAVAQVEPAGGDATKSQRRELGELGGRIYGAGTEEAETLAEISGDESLGRAQAQHLIKLGRAAAAALATTPSAAAADGELPL